ncbi:MAG: iron-containing alcohol dehydrogenase family protein [Lachnospiraceae bacterium]|nr:iron-containing alcohol dehydrogenase family protein [Lachnospiraceae bacterium]
MKNVIGSRISIPSILKVGNGTLKEVGKYLKENEFHSVVVFFGNGLIDMFGSMVMESLKKHDIALLDYRELDSTDINDIVELAFGIDTKTQAVLGIGGGKVIDVAKYAAYLRKMPFISVPTSASSDGFSSSSASLLVEGKRTSVPARLAYGIIVDTDVIKSAPDKFIYSGIGDLVSKITALYDWVYEDQQGYDTLNDFAMMIAKKAVNSFVRTSFESNSIKDDWFLRELVDSLAMSGIANEIAGNSAPSSGSEHLISHALDKILTEPQLHGIQVGTATYLMSLVQNHRYKRIHRIFTDTGFFEYVSTLGLRREDFVKAIDLAPSIKPYRHTYIHEEKYRELAKKILYEDEVFQKIFGC